MTGALLALLVAGAEADALGDWVPPKLLAAALLALLGGGIALGGYAVRALIKRLDKLEETVAYAGKEIGKLANFSTREEVSTKMGGMGARFDEKLAEVHRDVGGLRERLARIEERAPARVRK